MEQMAVIAEVVKNYTPEMATVETEMLLKALDEKDAAILALEQELRESEERSLTH